MPPIMLGSIAGAGATGSGLLATTASVVKIKLATDAAFCRAELGTGFNAATGEWVNMIEEGIIDPVKSEPFSPTKCSICSQLDFDYGSSRS